MSFFSRSRSLSRLKSLSKPFLLNKFPIDVKFISSSSVADTTIIYVPKTYFLKTYGCQMNLSDSNVVRSILNANGFTEIEHDNADIVLLNTCAVREHAENKVLQRITQLNERRKMTGDPHLIGILGCMTRHLKEKLLNEGADIVLGPDQYQHLSEIVKSPKYINIKPEYQHYDNIVPDRHLENNVSTYIPIMRGCNNMCSYCIVPYTRGRESSRKLQSIINEAKGLIDRGYKELILLGQNVNSYHDISGDVESEYELTPGFTSNYKNNIDKGYRFVHLLKELSDLSPEVRIRFISPHPKDFPMKLIDLIKDTHNICNSLQLPVQSGNTNVLKRMNRGYTRENYINLIDTIKAKIPNIYLETDLICGFCGETEEEHQDTVSLLKYVKYDQVYRFAYSMREHTYAFKHYKDNDLPKEVKLKRLNEINTMQNEISLNNGKKMIGRYCTVLVERNSKRSSEDNVQYIGKYEGNKMCVIHGNKTSVDNSVINKGDYVIIKVNGVSPQSYYGIPIMKTTLNDSFDKIKQLENTINK